MAVTGTTILVPCLDVTSLQRIQRKLSIHWWKWNVWVPDLQWYVYQNNRCSQSNRREVTYPVVYHFSASATAGPCLDNIVGSCESDAAVAKFAYRYLCFLEYQGEITIQQVILTSVDTRRKNNVIMTSKRRRDVVLMSKWRYYCAVCPLERSESTAIQWRRINVMVSQITGNSIVFLIASSGEY